MRNYEVVCLLEDIANMLEILGEDVFKIRAYRQAARSIGHLDRGVEEYFREGRLKDIPGVGSAIAAKLGEYLATGKMGYYDELASKIPSGLLDMLSIPGLGPKTVRLIYEHTGIDSLEDLYTLAREKKLRELPGIGAKTEYNIKKGISLWREQSEYVTLGTVMPYAQSMREYLASMPGVKKVELVGSIRRKKPVVRDIDILVGVEAPLDLAGPLRLMREVREVSPEGDGALKGVVGPGFRFEVIVVQLQIFPKALFAATGSKAHVQKITAMLGPRDFPDDEEKIYGSLGMPWIPPELREDKGEIEAALRGELPNLIEVSDLKGDLHVHTDWSDGAHGMEEMAKEARRRGYKYLAITEHSKSLKVSRGLDETRLFQQVEEIRKLNKNMRGFTVLTGIEVDILKDGTLDLPDETLKSLEVVVASVHSHFNLSREEQTKRIIEAVKNPHVDIIGHLSGRLLTRRPGYELDVDEVLKEVAKHKKVLEINAHPDRLDVDEEVAKKAKALGIKLAINSDAHHAGDMALMEYGVYSARRGWLTPEDVVNTRKVEELMSMLGKNRKG